MQVTQTPILLRGIASGSHHIDMYKEIKLKADKVNNLLELYQLTNTVIAFEGRLHELHDSGRLPAQICMQYVLEAYQLTHAAQARLKEEIWN